MQLRVLILPHSPIEEAEIYATGIEYFPPRLETKLDLEKKSIYLWLERIQDHRTLITNLFNEIVQYIDYLGNLLKQLSRGIDPKQDAHYWLSMSQFNKGFTLYATLKTSAPKTYQYVKLLEEKYIAFLQQLQYSIEQSDEKTFAVKSAPPTGFKIDELYEIFSQEKFKKIPLIQAFHALISYFESYVNVFRELYNDNYLKSFPNEWSTVEANISAGGIAVQMEKRFTLHQRVDVNIYFPEHKRLLTFDGNVVAMHSMVNSYLERTAINFEYPDGIQQNFLQTQIQVYEIEQTMDIPLK